MWWLCILACFLSSFDALTQTKPTKQKVSGIPGLDASTVSYAGYIPVRRDPEASIWYWFFEAANQNKSAPVLVWLNGGPGASSELGNLMENGPYSVNAAGTKLIPRKYNWASRFNVIFIDQPIGVGYSYVGDELQYVRTMEELGVDMYTMLVSWFELFDEYKNNEFFITGESYGGHYVPTIADAIVSNGNKGIPTLKGIAVGNGWSVPCYQGQYGAEYGFAMGFIDEKTRDKVLQLGKDLKDLCAKKDYFDALVTLGLEWGTLLVDSGDANKYNVRLHHPYNQTNIKTFLNTPAIAKALHAYPLHHKWELQSEAANIALDDTQMTNMAPRYINLLEHGVRVLIYNGQMDMFLSTQGQLAWMRGLKWSGQAKFNATERNTWRVDGLPAGFSYDASPFTFVEVFDAGHLVPHDQPKNALDMITRFVENKGWG